MSEDQKPKGNEKCYSLSPLSLDEALAAILKVEPKPRRKKQQPRRKATRKKPEVSAT
jgi:hypothetical protein